MIQADRTQNTHLHFFLTECNPTHNVHSGLAVWLWVFLELGLKDFLVLDTGEENRVR